MTDFANVQQVAWYRHRSLHTQSTYVALAAVVLIIGIALVEGRFLTAQNIYNVTRNFSFIGIAALGETLVIITAGIDLSVASVMALVGIVTGQLFELLDDSPLEAVPGLTLIVCVGLGLCLAALIGAVNGLLISRLGLSPFVTTLGMLSICRSVGYVLTQGRSVNLDGRPDIELFYALSNGDILGIPTPLIYMAALAVLMGVVLHASAWGRYVFAIGGNEHAAGLTGVPVERVKVSVYVCCSLLAGFAGILFAGWLGSVPANMAFGYELKIIAASVIGGANLAGGAGGPTGAVVGAALIEVIRNGLVLAQVNTYWQDTFVGLFIILAVLVDRLRARPSG